MKLILLFLTFSFSLSFSFLGKANVINIAIENKPWPPYYFGDKKINQKKPGLTVELLSLVEKSLKSEGVKFKYERFPWKRCFRYLKTNKVDAVLGASFKKKRMEVGHYPLKGNGPDESMGIAKSSYSFYKLKGNDVSWDGVKFSNLNKRNKIGVTAGYSIADDLKKMNVKVHMGKASKNLLEMVLKERLDGFAGFTDIVDNLMKNESKKYELIEKSEVPIKEKSYYLIFSYGFYKKNPFLAKKIWSKIKEIRRSQKYLDKELSYRE